MLRPQCSVGRDLGGAGGRLRRPADAVWRQAGVPNLIQQRAIADVQGPRSLLAVPVVVVQDFQNNFALQGARRLPARAT